MPYFTYILHSESADRYYIGSSENVEERIKKHNSGATPSIRPYRPWRVVWVEEYETRSAAVRRELQIKRMKSRKYIEVLVKAATLKG